MKIKLLILVLFLSLQSFSQGEASNWFFGNKAGIKFNVDNTITVLSTAPNPIAINTSEGCSSFSDPNGNLLIYTDGRTVWDRNHVVMPNGNYTLGTGLFGDPSSTQSGIIIPKPNDPNIYYIFTVDEPHQTNASVYPNQYAGTYDEGNGVLMTIPDADDGFNNGFNYSIVDISQTGTNGSVGDIISRNNHLVTYDTNPSGEEIKFKCSEKITAVRNRAGNGYWVITHFTNKFYVFKIDENGVEPNPVITTISPNVPVSGYRRNAIGQLKVSPNGKKIAIAHNQIGTQAGQSNPNGVIYLYDFDNETGIVSNGLQVAQNSSTYGVEFSAETRKLYTTSDNGVFQYNLESTDIPASAVQISTKRSASLQLGPDKKIYKANINAGTADSTLDVINDPELDGIACGYQEQAVQLIAGTSRFGLPPFITSVFNTNIVAKNLCFGETTLFELNANGDIDSAVWDFGDGSPTTTDISPAHVYPAPGNYTVTASIVVEGVPLNNSKNIQINTLPNASPATLTQCSTTTAATNIPFDLSQANAVLTNSNAAWSTAFFVSEADALANINPLPVQYSNTSNFQQLFVLVKDNTTECVTITTLDLIVHSNTNTPIVLRECDNDGTENGIEQFNLAEANIETNNPGATVIYYATLNDAFLEQNPISANFTNATPNAQTVYARAEASNDCLGIFPINLKVDPLPQIELTATDYICTNLPGRFTTLTPGLLQGNTTNYTYLWSTGQTTPTIQVNQAGNYTVKVTNVFGCEKSRTITVLPSNNATIQEVVIVDLVENNTVTVILSPESIGDYTYSLDLPDGPFQESNHFENVEAGFHTVYVNDNRGCGVTPKDISVLEIPNYFTPNQDGYNDTWNIIGINAIFYPNSKIYVFDRFGKLLADVNPKTPGWNGVYNGHNVPATDYWYIVMLDNGRTVRGHFSLLR